MNLITEEVIVFPYQGSSFELYTWMDRFIEMDESLTPK
jgi:hypothetical protein